jgi:glycosyltransferase involved in cell wall biosynthesis
MIEPVSDPAVAASPPMVSVVVPTRDRAALLRRAIAAVLGQDYGGDIECVVVFDQSPLELPEDLTIPPRRWLRAVVNRRTSGLAGARNTGILMARGQLIAYCDDDDEWLPAKLSAQVSDLASAPDCSVATTGIITVTGRRSRDRVYPQRLITRDMLLRSRIMEAHSSTLLIRRDALDRVGLVDEEIPGSYAEDYEWLLRASADGPLLVTQRPLVRVDMNPRSHFSKQWTSMVDANHYLIRRHPDLAGEPRGLARIYGRLAIAEAALGHRKRACRYAMRSLRLQPRQHRGFVALAISAGLVTADQAVRIANAIGRGL